MELRHLRQFLVLARELHFGRAAQKLGTAQPTLSQQIVTLERDLGVRLFDRTKRSVLLTNAGMVFLRETSAIVDQLEAASHHAREAARGRRGIILVGASAPPISSWLPHAIRAFGERYPDVEISMDVMHSRALIEMLRQRRLHVAFARAGIRADRVKTEVLWQHPFRVILPQGHPLGQHAAVHLRDLAGETLITYARSIIDGSFDQLIAFCRSEGFEPRVVKEVESLEAILGIVACGLGISILADNWSPTGSNTLSRDIALTKPSGLSALGTAAYWNTDETSPLLAALLDAIRSERDS